MTYLRQEIVDLFYPIMGPLNWGYPSVEITIDKDQYPLAEELASLYGYIASQREVGPSTVHLEDGDTDTIHFRGLDCVVTFTKGESCSPP